MTSTFGIVGMVVAISVAACSRSEGGPSAGASQTPPASPASAAATGAARPGSGADSDPAGKAKRVADCLDKCIKDGEGCAASTKGETAAVKACGDKTKRVLPGLHEVSGMVARRVG